MRRRHRWLPKVIAVALAVAGLALVLTWDSQFADRLAPARAAYEHRRWADAAKAAREILKRSPGDPEARKILARGLARAGLIEEAQRIFEGFRPQDLGAEDYFVVGAGLVARGDIAVGRKTLELALKLDPDHPEALLTTGHLDAGTDRLASAADLAGRLAKRPGWEVRGLAMLGLVADDQGEPSRAVEALREALRRDPTLQGARDTDPVRLVLARNLLRLGRPDEAEVPLREILEAGPNPEASWLSSRAALQRGDRAAFERALATAREGSFSGSHPLGFEPAPAVGAARCRECHEDIHRTQQHGRHSETFQPLRELAELPLPAGPVADRDNPKVVHRLERDGERIRLTSTVGDESVQAWLTYAVGSGDRGLTPVALDDRGQLRELRLSFYGDIHDWDRTTGHPGPIELGEPHDYLGRAMDRDLVRRCLGCHATDYRAARDGEGPTAADRGIGCERCHGPGGHHLTAVALKLDDLAIARPSRLPPAESQKICAECHSPKGRPLTSVDNEVRFQSLTLPRSRCFTASAGAFGCVTCHNPHRDADTDPSYYEAKCLACHGPAPAPAPEAGGPGPGHVALPEGSKRVPCPVEPAANCLECHMPQQKGVVPHAVFTDHHIRVHRPDPAEGRAE